MMNQIVQWSQGNPGAMTFLMKLTDPSNSMYAIRIASKISNIPIRGSGLYVLWSDICGKDISMVAKVCDNVPNDVLVDACSRQDYSGRKLIKKYII